MGVIALPLEAARDVRAVDARRIGARASRALIAELRAYPKPGLVSLVDTGSHADMDASHFLRSAFVLRRSFAEFARAGASGASFDALRRIGVAAEVAMTRATGGVNTHRGAIFAIGLLAAAAGARARSGMMDDATLGDVVRDRWGDNIAAHRRDPASHGSRVQRRCGTGGAQAEAAAGFPTVFTVALPAFRDARARGAAHPEAKIEAFFALLACVEDTNLIHRGGPEGLAFAQGSARDFLAAGGVHAPDAMTRAQSIHHAFIARRLSPGGSADLLAATLFAHADANTDADACADRA
ncbi:2-(5''-triphosphoribosyl)-3'-dephosphocoenzyme-A synthase [Usitatibacter rugosus]|uniref:Probable 2-(5''-triphosphoribosyl)-3'-dephosphocoenzyme-A synthase n=1 Tax=Usitatibacter rugosus TaxID=2732067 RepID=A0A6M4GXD7_9PROT|nr:triphosphoribosyl-dephospho-CoA synthase MdcB [Usitatibacter rugosus]QJR11926.1 2-(5''-triphosphoribosyl)-3'-dephosphocoenzyme-A synthase [Usitatibacter rugosus]